MTITDQLSDLLAGAARSLGLTPPAVHLSPPKNPAFGDYSTNLPLILARQAKKNPLDLARDLVDQLDPLPDTVAPPEITPPGFINFRLQPTYYYQVLQEILDHPDQYGRTHRGAGQTANVEFVSANPTGPLTVGHGRQAVLGDVVASILEWHGYEVTREYYYNDAGRQMRLLAASVEARYRELLGETTEFPEDGYQGEYIRDIARSVLATYGNALPREAPEFRREAETTIFQDIRATLEQLGVRHQIFSNEQTYYERGDIDRILSELKARDLIYEKDGATWLKTTRFGKEQDTVLIKQTGEPTYRLPDMAYHRDKFQRGFDVIVDIFGADHIATYPDVLAVLEALGMDTGRVRVLIHQFVTLVRGGEAVKMSTRKANFVTLRELVDRLGKDVVRYFFIMRGMNSHLNFDLDLAEDQSEKNPVFYLQYAHARIANILEHARAFGLEWTRRYDPKRLTTSEEFHLLKELDHIPRTWEAALDSLEPQVIAQSLQSLATAFHKFYTECRVVTDDQELSRARLALVTAVKSVLRNGLELLGIAAPDRM
ncbi:MAG: arginine--tRNA ligase [Candidatus Neomarinimicrobiota bacterium]|nr:MAG: arginine--tRNA ligase [Candidatus Neomarinimicrobiota bacterium]